MPVVGLVGFKQSGKDTAAAALVEKEGFVRIGFADAVKDMALSINPYVRLTTFDRMRIGWVRTNEFMRLSDVVLEVGWDEAKRVSDIREHLQRLGTEGVRQHIGEDSWLRAWSKTVDQSKADAIVVPDVRFENEAKYLREAFNTILVRVVRPGQRTTDQHDSEQEQLGIETDFVLNNKRDVAFLQKGMLLKFRKWWGE